MDYESLRYGAQCLRQMTDLAERGASENRLLDIAQMWNLSKVQARLDWILETSQMGSADISESSVLANIDNYQIISDMAEGEEPFQGSWLDGYNEDGDFYQSDYGIVIPVRFSGIDEGFRVLVNGTTWGKVDHSDHDGYMVDVSLWPGEDEDTDDSYPYQEALDDKIGEDNFIESLMPYNTSSSNTHANLVMSGFDVLDMSPESLRRFCVESLLLKQRLDTVKQAILNA